MALLELFLSEARAIKSNNKDEKLLYPLFIFYHLIESNAYHINIMIECACDDVKHILGNIKNA